VWPTGSETPVRGSLRVIKEGYIRYVIVEDKDILTAGWRAYIYPQLKKFGGEH
jgi:hypothetical protein